MVLLLKYVAFLLLWTSINGFRLFFRFELESFNSLSYCYSGYPLATVTFDSEISMKKAVRALRKYHWNFHQRIIPADRLNDLDKQFVAENNLVIKNIRNMS